MPVAPMNSLTTHAFSIFTNRADDLMNSSEDSDREELSVLIQKVLAESIELIEEVRSVFRNEIGITDGGFLETLLDTIEWPTFYRNLREEAFVWNQHVQHSEDDEDYSDDDLPPLPPHSHNVRCRSETCQICQNISG
jgi:hypothetical protein